MHCLLVCWSIVHSSLLAHSLHSALVVQRWPQTLRMTSAHVHSLLLHCSLVHSLLLLHSLLSALELPYEVHRTNPVKEHNAVMHWCTDALMMHSLTLLWCVVNL